MQIEDGKAVEGGLDGTAGVVTEELVDAEEPVLSDSEAFWDDPSFVEAASAIRQIKNQRKLIDFTLEREALKVDTMSTRSIRTDDAVMSQSNGDPEKEEITSRKVAKVGVGISDHAVGRGRVQVGDGDDGAVPIVGRTAAEVSGLLLQANEARYPDIHSSGSL